MDMKIKHTCKGTKQMLKINDISQAPQYFMESENHATWKPWKQDFHIEIQIFLSIKITTYC